MSGDSRTASTSPFFTRWPTFASMRVTRPETGENTWFTWASSKAILPLVTMTSSTSCSSSGSTLSFASAICASVSQTSPSGASARASAVAALRLQPAPRAARTIATTTPQRRLHRTSSLAKRLLEQEDRRPVVHELRVVAAVRPGPSCAARRAGRSASPTPALNCDLRDVARALRALEERRLVALDDPPRGRERVHRRLEVGGDGGLETPTRDERRLPVGLRASDLALLLVEERQRQSDADRERRRLRRVVARALLLVLHEQRNVRERAGARRATRRPRACATCATACLRSARLSIAMRRSAALSSDGERVGDAEVEDVAIDDELRDRDRSCRA